MTETPDYSRLFRAIDALWGHHKGRRIDGRLVAAIRDDIRQIREISGALLVLQDPTLSWDITVRIQGDVDASTIQGIENAVSEILQRKGRGPYNPGVGDG